MRNHYSSSVLLDGYLYGFSSRILTAMKFDTGEVSWQDRSVGKGQIIAAEGLLYLLGEDGVDGFGRGRSGRLSARSRGSRSGEATIPPGRCRSSPIAS